MSRLTFQPISTPRHLSRQHLLENKSKPRWPAWIVREREMERGKKKGGRVATHTHTLSLSLSIFLLRCLASQTSLPPSFCLLLTPASPFPSLLYWCTGHVLCRKACPPAKSISPVVVLTT
ncbi:hypothetical protein LX32DRAFT_49435 [Colletotrichum zoysiae]|uniref:Uncharacterized protein n=1 Tax=Colletotrichum zoysiae TaxID=1216348 RepID=A0AAD9LYK1_9PEZI|nr:hypothetical protein LX32DRAFT_49435 [Colletotrichum zoysiae]